MSSFMVYKPPARGDTNEQQSVVDNDIGGDANTNQSLRNIELNWSKLNSGYGRLCIFGMSYWLILTIIAFAVQSKDPTVSWLFDWCIISLFTALIIQFGLITIVVAGYENKTTHFLKREFPITTAATFPYSLLICVDLCIHVNTTFTGKQYIHKAFSFSFIICDSLSLLFLSYLDFVWEPNKTFRIINFTFEWIDILSQVIVILLYAANSTAKNSLTILKVYWAFTFIQLIVWIPLICLNISKNIHTLLHWVIFLDFITDLPIIITTIVAKAYHVNGWIFVDLVFKMVLMIRAVVVNGCVYILLPRLANTQTRQEIIGNEVSLQHV